MEEEFEITITYEHKEIPVILKLMPAGYTFKFVALINEIEVTYEPDEDRNYRAMITAGIPDKLTTKDRAIINLIGEKLNTLRD
jgi:hypothetical protein